MDIALEAFERHWRFARGMTYEFIEGVDEAHWLFTPHCSCSPLAKQFRHMAWVAGLYNDGLKTGALNFGRKKTFYEGSLDKATIVASLRTRDAELSALLGALAPNDLRDRRIDLGDNRVSVHEFTNVIMQHEAIHQGLWTMYARLGGFQTPESWQANWEL
ncbi:MAG TPA: DinB family protein [Caulobacteraceae bacterium]|jgi:uncharacterized damage-inducible protein DinB|nr:DinB family protein [Caulobacteraceae bacterium]